MRGRAWRQAETLGHTQSWNRNTGVWSSCWPVADSLQTKLWQDLLHHCGRRDLFPSKQQLLWYSCEQLNHRSKIGYFEYVSCQYIANLSCCSVEPLSFHDPWIWRAAFPHAWLQGRAELTSTYTRSVICRSQVLRLFFLLLTWGSRINKKWLIG